MKLRSSIKFLPFILIFFFCPSIMGMPIDTAYLKQIENNLRNDYFKCTGDTSNPPLGKILEWKKAIDSITETPNYLLIVKKYRTDNFRNDTLHSPCEIMNWFRNKNFLILNGKVTEKTKLEEAQRDSASKYLKSELSKVKQTTVDFNKMPFGISKRALQLMLHAANELAYTDNGTEIYYNQYDSLFHTIAFFFNKDSVYNRYEIESITTSLDSIDVTLRSYIDKLSLFFQSKTGIPPSQSNYVGRFEITEGALSICRIWSLKNAKVYIGLATYQNRYYAKVIVKTE